MPTLTAPAVAPQIGTRVMVTCRGYFGTITKVAEIRPSSVHGMSKPLYVMANGQWLDRSEFDPKP